MASHGASQNWRRERLKLAIFDDYRLGVISDGDSKVTDVTSALPWPHDPDPVGAGWWVRLCRDLSSFREQIEATARKGPARPAASWTPTSRASAGCRLRSAP